MTIVCESLDETLNWLSSDKGTVTATVRVKDGDAIVVAGSTNTVRAKLADLDRDLAKDTIDGIHLSHEPDTTP